VRRWQGHRAKYRDQLSERGEHRGREWWHGVIGAWGRGGSGGVFSDELGVELGEFLGPGFDEAGLQGGQERSGRKERDLRRLPC
jgi:hypothetical protein